MDVLGGLRTLLFCFVLEAIFIRFFALSGEFESIVEDLREFWIDSKLRIEYHLIWTALVVVQWTRTLLVGAQLERCLGVVYAVCIQPEFNSFRAVLLVSSLVAFLVRTLQMRLSLRCRKRKKGVQLKKKTSGLKRKKRFEQRLQFRGLSFLILMSCGHSCNAMDGEQFRQFMTGFGTLLQKQDVIVRGITESLSASSSSTTAKGLESAARILKSPEQFDPTSETTWNMWRHSFLNWLSYADGRFLASIQDIEKLTPSDAVETADW